VFFALATEISFFICPSIHPIPSHTHTALHCRYTEIAVDEDLPTIRLLAHRHADFLHAYTAYIILRGIIYSRVFSDGLTEEDTLYLMGDGLKFAPLTSKWKNLKLNKSEKKPEEDQLDVPDVQPCERCFVHGNSTRTICALLTEYVCSCVCV
jgi:hypothetical protein